MTVNAQNIRIPERARKKGLPDILQDSDIHYLVEGSDDRRYGLVKRALSRGDLIQVRRGLYILGDVYRRRSVHMYELAQKIYGPSYISTESALAVWNLIPEATYSIMSGCSGRLKEFQTPFGHFSYARIPYQPLFMQVLRKNDDENVYFIATPLRALADYVYLSKREWTWPALQESLRLEDVSPFLQGDIQEMQALFKNHRVQTFLKDYVRRMY